jgi:hypothetical protein
MVRSAPMLIAQAKSFFLRERPIQAAAATGCEISIDLDLGNVAAIGELTDARGEDLVLYGAREPECPDASQ